MATEIPTHNKLGFPVVPCSRCCGDGNMDHYRHVEGGRCFQCLGERVVVKPGKAAKAWKAYKEAVDAAEAATYADVKIGDTFKAGTSGWTKLISVEPDPRNAGYVKLTTTKGGINVKPEFPTRIHRPGAVDVTEYLKGL